jgi:hypothetical protein
LRAALARGGAVTLCPRSYISLGSQIEISEVTADVHCPTKDCTIDGRGSTRLFLGAPTKLTVDGVLFLDGKASRSYGGAFLLANSSSTYFRDCMFQSNSAEVRLSCVDHSSGLGTISQNQLCSYQYRLEELCRWLVPEHSPTF